MPQVENRKEYLEKGLMAEMTVKEKPLVSIIIPTYNRRRYLKNALKSLENINYPEYEVIVVDDGSTDGTGEMISAMRDKLSFRLRYYHQENKGLSSARNLALKNGKGDIFVSVDDDMLFEKDWLDKLVVPLNDPEVGVTGGPPVAPPDVDFFSKCVDYCMTSFIGTGGVRGTTKFKIAGYYPRGGNMAFRRDAIEKAGTFDERLAPGEDIDLDYRIEKAGYILKYVPDAFVWHIPRTTLKGFLKQIYGRGYARALLCLRYKELSEPVYALPSIMILAFLTALILSPVFPFFLHIGLVSTLTYTAIIVSFGILSRRRVKEVRSIIVIPFLLAAQHITYGIGFLAGVLCRHKSGR